MTTRRLPAIAAALAVVLVACGGGSSEPQATSAGGDEAAAEATPATTAQAPAADTASVDAAVAVPAALDFTASLLDGAEIEMGQFAGRPVLLWFWAPW